MGSLFKPSTTVVQAPSQQTVTSQIPEYFKEIQERTLRRAENVFNEPFKSEHKYDSKIGFATENYRLNLWNPFVIYSWYKTPAEDQRVVVEYDGFEEIETHEFEYFVERKKRLWWKSFRVVNRNLSNSTKFDRRLDAYLTRGY